MEYKTIKLLMIIVVSTLFSTFISESATPRFINFQGRLTDQQGTSLEGTYNLKFSLYPSADPNISPLWTEEHTNVSANKGMVNVLLGSIQSFDEPVKVTFDQERYLGITIDCDHDPNTKEPEMIPRQRILPAIYAYTAGTAYNADSAGNADKLDGKDSSEYTTPEKDAGRPGVVENLYEGNIRLVDKYIKAEGGSINGDLNITGNVGIGTIIPDCKLSIQGDITNTNLACIKLLNKNGNRIFALTDEGNGLYTGFYSAGKMMFYTNGRTNYPSITFDNLGHIGIGTADTGDDSLDVRGRAYASGGWQITDSDYAEWFEKEEAADTGDIIGINLETGKARRYRTGDRFIGIYSTNPGYIGNRLKESDKEMTETHMLVGLLGQLDFNKDQVIIRGRSVETTDGKEVGILLSNGKVLIQ